MATTRDTHCVTPIITGADVKVIESTYLNGGYAGWRCFTGEFLTTGVSYIPIDMNWVLGWMLGISTPITYVTIYYDYKSGRYPTQIAIDGTNDNGSNWTTIKTFNTNGMQGLIKYTYDLGGVFNYKGYRYRVISSVAGSPNYFYVGEIEFCYVAPAGSSKHVAMPVTIV